MVGLGSKISEDVFCASIVHCSVTQIERVDIVGLICRDIRSMPTYMGQPYNAMIGEADWLTALVVEQSPQPTFLACHHF
ncbi:hypothetical protein ES702_00133 [subsurface metagenome]